MARPWTLVLDFDGTITTRDADVVIAEHALADPSFVGSLIDDYEALRITTAEYFAEYLARLALPPDAFAHQAAVVPLRPGLDALVRWCERAGVEVHVASEGLDVYIRPILTAAHTATLPLTCNVARWDGQGYDVQRAPGEVSCERCLTCKGGLVRRLKAEGRRVALVGNGASDLCGARDADLVCARDSLADHCVAESISYQTWQELADVQRVLEPVVRGGAVPG